MNYRHIYHAGNFADVIKHTILLLLISSLKKKETPFCFIDTHAGPGCYDLETSAALKTEEFKNGIEKIIQQTNFPPLITLYLQCIHEINNKLNKSTYASLRYYPGSPMLVRHLLRPKDRVIACELHPEDYQNLRQNFSFDKQVITQHTDGFLSLKGLLPPKERRGLILIDPPYEDTDEYIRIIHALLSAVKRFSTGIYLLWYPIKDYKHTQNFYETLKKNFPNYSKLIVELLIHPDLPHHLNGCGLFILNPPWQTDENINTFLPWLWKCLSVEEKGYARAFFLE